MGVKGCQGGLKLKNNTNTFWYLCQKERAIIFLPLGNFMLDFEGELKFKINQNKQTLKINKLTKWTEVKHSDSSKFHPSTSDLALVS